MEDCVQAAANSGMFALCSEPTLRQICARTTAVTYPKNAVVYRQGETQTEMLLLKSGSVETTKIIEGQEHTLDVTTSGAVSSNHALVQDPAAVTVRCLTPVTGFSLQSAALDEVLEDKTASREVMHSLSKEIRRQASLLQTPLFEQHAKPTPYFATSVAASIESFYRSGMNALLNARLTGQPVARLFPEMHLQIPTRVVYINGFKGIRHLLEKHVDADQYEYPQLVRLLEAVSPGVIMTPVSSMLEAFNAGHMNPESLTTRWIRGFWPRCLREVIFGVGLNQLSDYFEERLALTSSAALNNAIGSLAAGVVSGYFSHVPHNLSTMKLMNPQKPYSAHMADFIKHSESRVPASVPQGMRPAAATALALLFPRGLTVRTTQIVGSFNILNGTINSLKGVDVDSVQAFFSR
jgi:CRP-like cAMP-binding protein